MKVAGIVVLVFSLGANGLPAQAALMGNAGYVVDSSNQIVMSGSGECWHTIVWTPALAVEGCEKGASKPAAKAAEAAPATRSVAQPTPAPAAVVASVSAPKADAWKTVLSDKPFRLEGASFATGSSALLASANEKLQVVVDAAKQHPEIALEVSGYTDDRGSKANNQKLSQDRADAVKVYLVKQGVAVGNITAKGYADAQPIADNNTAAGRAANRRVEVRYVIKEETKVRVTE